MPRRHLQNFRQRAMQIVRRLCAAPNRQLSLRVSYCHGSVLLDRKMCVPLIKKSILEHFVRFLKPLVYIAKFQRHALMNVSFFPVLMNPRHRSRQRFFRVGDRRQNLVIHINQVQRFKRRQLLAGDHRRNRITDVAHVIQAKRLLVLAHRQNSIFDGEIFSVEN